MKYDLPRNGRLSYSQIFTYLKCARAYWFQYFDEKPRRPSMKMTLGSTLHKVFEMYFTDKIDGQQLYTPKQAGELSMDVLDDLAKENGIAINDTTKDEASKILIPAASSYISTVAPDIEPIATEKEIRYTADCGVEIKGYIDLVRHPHEWEAEIDSTLDQVIVDYKTGKPLGEKCAADSLQLMMYAFRLGTKKVEIHNINTGLKSKPKVNSTTRDEMRSDFYKPATNIKVVRHTLSGHEHTHVDAIIEGVAEAITKRAFPPAEPSSWGCSEDQCDYWFECRGKK